MNKDLKYMPIDDKAGTFMSKHCSPVSYGTPLEKKSCANYGSPLDQSFQDDAKPKNSMAKPDNSAAIEAYKSRAKKTKLSQKVQDSLFEKNQHSGKISYLPNKGVYFDVEDKVLINPPKGRKEFLKYKNK